MKPNLIVEPVVKFNPFIPIGKLFIMMWKGKLLIKNKDKEKWEKYKNMQSGKEAINHEMYHIKQAVSTYNNWILYYIFYVWEYIKNLPIIFGFEFPYRFNAFELEAYANQHKKVTISNWKYYKKYTLKEKRKLWKQYKNMKKQHYISFSTYAKRYIK